MRKAGVLPAKGLVAGAAWQSGLFARVATLYKAWPLPPYLRPTHEPRLGILLKISSLLFFTIMFACVKLGSAEVPPGETAFFRSFFCLIPVIAWLVYKGDFPGALATKNPIGHLWRGAIGMLAMSLQFTALALLPLHDVVALGYAMPLFAVIFAAFFLGETIHRFRWNAVFIGFVGVMVILWPRLSYLRGEGTFDETWGAAAALAGAAAIALATVVLKKLISGERTETIVFYFGVNCSLFTLMTAPLGWFFPDVPGLVWQMPSPPVFGFLVLAGISGGIAQLMLTASLRYADNSTIATFEYASILFSVIASYMIFGDLPTIAMLVGAVIIVSSGMYVMWREQKLLPTPAKQAT